MYILYGAQYILYPQSNELAYIFFFFILRKGRSNPRNFGIGPDASQPNSNKIALRSGWASSSQVCQVVSFGLCAVWVYLGWKLMGHVFTWPKLKTNHHSGSKGQPKPNPKISNCRLNLNLRHLLIKLNCKSEPWIN